MRAILIEEDRFAEICELMMACAVREGDRQLVKGERSPAVVAEAVGRAPKFKHDSDCCTFLGRHETTDSDLYFCAQHGIPTLIARYSSQGIDYASGLAFSKSYPELAEAERLAISAGHIPPSK